MIYMNYLKSSAKIAFIGNYLPRKCGIATYTTDLHRAVAAAQPENDSFVLAMNDPKAEYDYPHPVRFEIRQNILTDYKSAAEFLNLTEPSVVCLQHEYGIFGGREGGYILTLLEDLTIPVVTTLHTVLKDPNRDQYHILRRLCGLSSRLVVMSKQGANFLTDIYSVSPDKIDVIPHGIPDVPFTDPNFYKDKLHVEGKHVLLTFGLISPNKGVEYVISALPEILAHIPNLVYVVLGATHPYVKRQDGERYRRSLKQLAEDLGVAENVHFHDRFVEIDELIEFIGAADIYITPYLNQAQIVSGTLAYSVGSGKAVISTPYWYAQELLEQGRGALVPFEDSAAIASQVLQLLRDEAERHGMRKRAYLYGRGMTWPVVARLYLESFAHAQQGLFGDKIVEDLARGESRSTPNPPRALPELCLDHLWRLTDDLGILQHAIFHLPNYAEGYTTDDNARALMFVLKRRAQGYQKERRITKLLSRYLAFLWYAFNPATNRFRNFLSYDRCWLENVGSEDSQGLALWSLGAVLGQSQPDDYRNAGDIANIALRLFDPGLPPVLDMTSPRAWAFTLLGIYAYLQRFPGDRAARAIGKTLAERLASLYRESSALDWPWYEETVSYSNAHLPHAMLLTSQWTEQEEYAQIGFESLEWLAFIQTSNEGHYVPIGSNGFYHRGGQKARFDQQPIEAGAMVAACLEAYRLSRNNFWLDEAIRAFGWFLGANDLGLPLYDPNTGGCHDGLHPDRLNRNQGAESTLSFLTSLVEISYAMQEGWPRTEGVAVPSECNPLISPSESDPKPANSANGRMRLEI